MKLSNKICIAGLLAMSFSLQSCNDFFETDPKNIINEGDYIAEEDEMYKGFLGIFNRVQEAGDHAIFLTDTRAALLETTDKLLADIAAETGFFDQSHLTRVFKKERGMTPGEYRHRHRSIRGPTTSNKISRP